MPKRTKVNLPSWDYVISLAKSNNCTVIIPNVGLPAYTQAILLDVTLSCGFGHIWTTKVCYLFRNHWCLECSRGSKEKISLGAVISHIEKKGGSLVSGDYINYASKLVVKCEEGHTWTTSVYRLMLKGCGKWCPDCLHGTKEEMVKFAATKNGKFISETYTNRNEKYTWQCRENHEWSASANNIINKKSWCPYCDTYISETNCRVFLEKMFNTKFVKIRPKWLTNSRGNRMELDGYSEELKLAFEYNGSQHYAVDHFYTESKVVLEQSKEDDKRKLNLCKNLRIALIVIPTFNKYFKFTDLPKFIKEQCERLNIAYSEVPSIDSLDMSLSHSVLQLNMLREIIESKGGELLTNNYIGSTENYLVKCSKSHVWSASYSSIKRGSWCKKCSGINRKDIAYCQYLAGLKNGKCISTNFINMNTKLEWRCSKGHIWSAKPTSVQQNHWCPECADRHPNRRKDSYVGV